MIRLRDYQQQAHNCIMESFEDHQAVLTVLATGLGKTVVAAHIADHVAAPMKLAGLGGPGPCQGEGGT